MKTKSSPLWRLKVVLYEGWNSIQMTGDESEFLPFISRTPVFIGVSGEKMKGEE